MQLRRAAARECSNKAGNLDSPPRQPTEEEESLRTIANAIELAGMAIPASIALHIARPLAWTGGQMLWVLQPLLGAIGIGSRPGALSISRLARLMEGEASISGLIEQLDSKVQRR